MTRAEQDTQVRTRLRLAADNGCPSQLWVRARRWRFTVTGCSVVIFICGISHVRNLDRLILASWTEKARPYAAEALVCTESGPKISHFQSEVLRCFDPLGAPPKRWEFGLGTESRETYSRLVGCDKDTGSPACVAAPFIRTLRGLQILVSL